MTTLIVEKANFSRTRFLDEKDLFLYIIEYIQDLEDKNDVINAMKNDTGAGISLDNFISKYGK